MANNNSHKMTVMSRGELEDITKPASSRSRPGSKVTNITGSTSIPRAYSKRDTALELLTPEEVMDRQGYDMQLMEYDSSGSEYTSEESEGMTTNVNTARTSEIFNIAEPNTDRSEKMRKQRALDWEQSPSEEDDYAVTRQIKLMEDEAEVEVNSDEERDIMAEIRAEITMQVRGEMKDELAVYQAKREQLKSPPEDIKGPDQMKSDLDDLEPKLRDAILKMRKLDKILERKMKREKQVKRDRIMLQKRLKEELENIKPEGRDETREVKTNMSKFLALTLPPSHNEGVQLVENKQPSPPATPVTPVFHTQLPDENDRKMPDQQSTGSNAATSRQTGATPSMGSEYSNDTDNTNTTSGQHRRKKKKKDFIKRNMELATDAGNTIAMTDDEKKRVEDLLADLETLPEIPESLHEDESFMNPYQLQLVAGEGFIPEKEDINRLDHIDKHLKELLPPEDFAAVASVTPRNMSGSMQSLFSRTGILSNVDELGEQALRDVRGDRDIQKRLQEIEYELSHLTSAVELEIESPTLSEDQLNDLLDMCSRTMSRATEETESIAHTSRSDSSRATLLENPPVLPDDVLQSLLSDARKAITGSNTPDSQRSPQHSSEVHQEEDLILESISEDTIKELLKNSRATSRAASRASLLSADSQSHIIEEPQRPLSRPKSDSQGRIRNTEPTSKFADNNKQENDKYEKKPFLPAIDPKGTMSTQRLNNQRLNNEECVGSRTNMSHRTSAFMVHNSLNSASEPNMSRNYDSEGTDNDDTPTHTPHPPSRQRPNSAGKNGTASPFTKNSLE